MITVLGNNDPVELKRADRRSTIARILLFGIPILALVVVAVFLFYKAYHG